MFAIFELKTMPLDSGIPGVSPTHLLLVFGMMYAIAMIPYAFLYLSLRDRQGRASLRPFPTTNPFRKMIAWVHAHQHPELLHH